LNFYRKDPGKFERNAIGSLAVVRAGEGVDRPVPAMVIVGGEGQGAREQERVEAHLKRGLDGVREGRKGLIGGGTEHGGGGERRQWCCSEGLAVRSGG
jgi:hypothetical protein